MSINTRAALIAHLQQAKKTQKSVVIVGLGISGLDAAAFLVRLGLSVVGLERRAEASVMATPEIAAKVAALRAAGATIQCGVDGEHCQPFLVGACLAVLSPGVSLEGAIVGSLRRAEIPMVGEFELGLVLAGQRTVAVTGSNGKSTTVSLIKHMFDCAQHPARLCGNIGTPVVQHLDAAVLEASYAPPEEVLVVEASSYQLESCSMFRPDIGVFINLSDNHLERHGSMDRYFEAKMNAFVRQTSDDWVVSNIDDPFGERVVSRARGRVATVSRVGRNGGGQTQTTITAAGEGAPGMIRCQREGGPVQSWRLDQTRLKGRHNTIDIALAATAASLAGLPASAIQAGINSFVPLEHRLELLPTVEAGRVIINDSKSTTVAATVAAVEAVLVEYSGRPITLLVGGLAKAGSWAPLIALLKRHPTQITVVLFGRDGKLIGSTFSAAGVSSEFLGTLSEATQAVVGGTNTDPVILLSPGCASFDEFSDFEARGRRFKELCAAVHP